MPCVLSPGGICTDALFDAVHHYSPLTSVATTPPTRLKYRPCPGGFLGPYAVGALHQRSGGYGAAMGLMGVCLAAATVSDH